MLITHPKIASLAPSWAPFSGYSVIFEGFGIGALENEPENPAHDFYRELGVLLEKADISSWREKFGLCSLPPDTYHLTIADLINDGNTRMFLPAVRGRLCAQDGKLLPLEQIADDIRGVVRRSGVMTLSAAPLFKFEQVVSLSNRVLVVLMQPESSPESLRAFEEMIAARDRIAVILKQEFGVKTGVYRPHVSLGYFANEALPPAAADHIERLDRACREKLADKAVSFGAPNLFTFTDMASFRRCAVQ